MAHQESPEDPNEHSSKNDAGPPAKRWQRWFGASLVIFSLAVLSTQTNATTPKVAGYAIDDVVEKGKVKWSRDIDAAQKASAANGKPLLVLFQEIPG